MESRPQIASAWPKYPHYRIDLIPCPQRARAWAGEVLVADSTAALRVEETDHQPMLYFPLADIRLDLMRATDHHTICPFKGQADYHSIDLPAVDGDNVLWSYPDPFSEVAGLAGYGAFYHDRVRVELIDTWPDGSGDADPDADTVVTQFPTWGDVTDLVDVLDVRPAGAARYVSVTRPDRRRGVVEGSQLLAQAIVAAGKHAPDRRVVSAHMVFSRAADPDLPVEIELDPVSEGRTFGALAVRVRQGSRECAPGVLLLDTGAPSLLTHQVAAPTGPGPSGAVPYDMGVTGRDLRIVDAAYDPDPDRVGPPQIDAWMRYREVPDVDYLHAALLAQFTGHLSIGAALRPHAGFGERDAHRSLSTAIMAITLALHRPVRMTDWLLFSHHSTFAGHGMTHAECRVFTEAGDLVASFTVEAMVRAPASGRAELDERRSL